jgi:hypothetical protein
LIERDDGADLQVILSRLAARSERSRLLQFGLEDFIFLLSRRRAECAFSSRKFAIRAL